MNATAPTWCLSPRLAPRAAQAKGGVRGPLGRGANGSCLFPHLRPERWLRAYGRGRWQVTGWEALLSGGRWAVGTLPGP